MEIRKRDKNAKGIGREFIYDGRVIKKDEKLVLYVGYNYKKEERREDSKDR